MKIYRTTQELPQSLPMFPLAGALLLPRAELPLNIFETRYLAMFDAAMSGERMVGMIQPVAGDSSDVPELVRIGCAGRITSFAETDDDRLLVSLTGVCRFEVQSEQVVETPYRLCTVAYDRFAADLVAENGSRAVNRDAVLKAFRQYLEANSMSANWDDVAQVSTESLVNSLSQLAPYPADEKQALLEAEDLKARADMLIALTELALARSTSGKQTTLQ